MGNSLAHRTPEQLKLRRITLMRVAFISMLIGNGISIFTFIVSSLHSLSLQLGDPQLDFVLKILTFSDSLTLISAALAIAGSILLLIALAKLGENGSNKLKRKSRITFFLLIFDLILNFAFTYLISSLALWGVLNGQDIDTLLSITPLLTIAIGSSFYIFLGFTIRQVKTDHHLGSQPLITTFIYPITFGLRLLLLFDIFSSIVTKIIASLIVSILGLIILIVFFSSALIGLKRVKNKISIKPQPKVLPTRKGAKFCANCGAPIESIASFCANCGHPIE